MCCWICGGVVSHSGATSGSASGGSSSLLLSSCRRNHSDSLQGLIYPSLRGTSQRADGADLLSTSGQLPLSAVSGLSPRPLLFGPLPVLLIRSLGNVLETSLQFFCTYARYRDRRRNVSQRTSGNTSARGTVMTYRPPTAVSSRRLRWGSPCPRSQLHSRGGKRIVVHRSICSNVYCR